MANLAARLTAGKTPAFGMGGAAKATGVPDGLPAMRGKPHFPIYTIVSVDGILVRRHRMRACVLLFESRELAQAHIDELARLDIGFQLHTLEIADGLELRRALAG